MSDKFNDIFKSKLENHQVPADHLWQSIASQIPASNTGFWKPWMTAASSAVGVAAVATIGWLGFKTDEVLVSKALENTSQSEFQTVPSAIETPKAAQPFNAPQKSDDNTSVVTQSEPLLLEEPSVVFQESEGEDFVVLKSQSIPSVVDLNSNQPSTPVSATSSTPSVDREASISAYFTVVNADSESLKYFFFAAQTAASEYHWVLTNSETTETFTEQSFSYQFEQQGEYTLSLTVNVNGKELSKSQNLHVYLPSKLNPVNAFAPGIDGLNDVFDALANSRNISDVVEFKITDGNGRTVYTQSHGATWDGRIAGDLASPGRYLWTIEFLNTEGKPVVQRGDIQVFAE